jgi:predicted amino acid dehydrogenase
MIGDALSVICDIAVPSDTDPRVLTKRPGIAYIMGGVVAVPNNPAFKLNGVPLSPGYAYACMCETMTLGFEGVKGGFSYGAISRGQVEEIHSMAASNGFRLGKYKTDTSY